MRTGGEATAAMVAALAALAAGPVVAQTVSPPAATPAPVAKPAPAAKAAQNSEDDDLLSEVVVTAGRPQPGAVIGDIKPELQLTPADIQSYGVSTVTELLAELAPQTRSGRGRGSEGPVVLLNGRRISSFAEIRDIPTEAIARVDILPEEVALKYGYTANQRVINFVLRRRFRATTVEGGAGGSTAGGQAGGAAEVDLLRVQGDNRINFDLKYDGKTGLTEADRDITSLAAGRLYSGAGAVTAVTPGVEIDPRLSALAGRPVTVAGVPSGAGRSLADFASAATPAVVDDRAQRSLLPETQSISANAVIARVLPWRLSGTLNATLGATSSDSLQGLTGLSLLVPAGDPFSPFARDVVLRRQVGSDPLRQSTEGWTAHLGGTLNRDTAHWRFSLTSAYDHADSDTASDIGVNGLALQALLAGRSSTFDPFAGFGTLSLLQNRAHSDTDTANLQGLANGPLFKVPAGQVYASFKVGDAQNWLSSTSVRSALTQATDLSRNDFNAQVNVDLPLTSRRNNVLTWAGELSLNGNAAINQLSDFGELTTVGYGLNWRPITGLSLILSHTHDEAAPTVGELGAPVIATAQARIFDYARGQTVDVTRLDGGNPNLVSDTREVSKLGLTWKPWSKRELTLQANYVTSRIDNSIRSFPAATADTEAAFPGRFQRDATGALTQVDFRPVNFAREDREELRYGINYSFAWKPKWLPTPKPTDFVSPDALRRFAAARQRTGANGGQPPEGGAPPDGPPPGAPDGPPPGFGGQGGAAGGGGGGGGGGPGGGGRGGGGAPRDGHLQFAVYHTVIFTDRLLARPGAPVFDLLNGFPSGNTGGQSQHEIEAQAGYSVLGIGARLSFDWKSATTVRGGALGSTAGDLAFSDLSTVNLRLFADFGRIPKVGLKHPFLRGARLSVSINNLFDEKIDVRDATGAVPISYQPDYLDPTGRSIRVGFRKLFF